MTRAAGACALLLSVALAARGSSPDPPPTPSPAVPSPGPTTRLRLDIDANVRRVLETEDPRPRFAEAVEVRGKSPQLMLERILRGFDLDCGPAGGGAPTVAETRAVRPHPAASADFLALARAIMAKHESNASPRYFIYEIRQAGRTSFVLREGRLPTAERYNTPGTTFALVDSFASLGSATEAMRRLQRGMGAEASASADPLPPWVTSPCRRRQR